MNQRSDWRRCWRRCAEEDVPAGIRWCVLPQHQGQMVERAYAQRPGQRSEPYGGFEDGWKRVTDRSMTAEDRVCYFMVVRELAPGLTVRPATARERATFPGCDRMLEDAHGCSAMWPGQSERKAAREWLKAVRS